MSKRDCVHLSSLTQENGGVGVSPRLGSPERPEKSIKVHFNTSFNVVKFGDGTDVKVSAVGCFWGGGSDHEQGRCFVYT